MTTTSGLPRTTPVAVPPTGIGRGLQDLWRSCCPAEPGGQVNRALAINFVGVAAVRHGAELRETLDRVARRMPCRAFLVELDDAVTGIDAAVSAATRALGNTQEIVLEQVDLRLPAAAFAKVVGIVRPLLENDLPTHLFWALPGPNAVPNVEPLLDLCDHVVVDSARSAAPAADLHRLRKWQRTRRKLSDLNWLRLRAWQRALAEGFERVQYCPGDPVAVTIRCASPGIAASLLLGRWLEQRLEATVSVEPDDQANEAANGPQPVAVLLEQGDTAIEAVFDAGQIRVMAKTATICFVPFVVPASRGSVGDLVAAAIDLA